MGIGLALAVGLSAGAMAQQVSVPAKIPDMAGKVLTVNGPIQPSQLGDTLIHEHIFIDFKAPPPVLPMPTDITVSMLKAGHASQIVLSHASCTPAQLKVNGGGGYTCINDVILSGLKAKGVSAATIHEITVENPARVLTFVAAQAPVQHKATALSAATPKATRER